VPSRSEKTQALIEDISRIAINGSAAHDRRRNEVIQTVKSPDDLTKCLLEEGFQLSRSKVYLHLLPKILELLKVNVTSILHQ